MVGDDIPLPFPDASKQVMVQTALDLLKIACLAGNKALQTDDEVDMEPLSELIEADKGELVKLIGNLVYRNKELQSLCGSLGAIDVCLSNCQIDDRNPMVREWAILALRNLMEDHAANQALVSGLHPETVANNTELSRMGLEAIMDNKTGRITVRSVNQGAK